MMKKRSYKITFGLKEGYTDKGKLHTLGFAEKVIKGCMKERIKNKFPVFSGFLQAGILIYPAVGDEHKNGLVTASESAVFTGDLSSGDDAARDDKEVKSTLESLALRIKKELKQESVYIVYRKRNWCV